MLETIRTYISYTSNRNLHDYKEVAREYTTAKNLMQVLEDFENAQATTKEIHVFKKDKEIEINLDYKKDFELINNEIKELEKQQETLTFKAYVEKSKELATRKNALIEKYAFLKVKVISIEYENAIRLNELKDLPQAFTTFIERSFQVRVSI